MDLEKFNNSRYLQYPYTSELCKKTATDDNQNNYVQYYIDNKHDGVYLDCLPSNASYKYGWKFEPAKGYDAKTNKIYKISTYGDKDGNCRYLTATPEDTEGNFCNAISETPQNSEYQLWKLITLKEYYELFDKSPSDLSSPIDATFLIQNPGFNYNTSNSEKWFVPTNPDNVRFGVEDYYKKKQKITTKEKLSIGMSIFIKTENISAEI